MGGQMGTFPEIASKHSDPLNSSTHHLYPPSISFVQNSSPSDSGDLKGVVVMV